jgi:glycosyltransferase involved in cell wall biosynthesis
MQIVMLSWEYPPHSVGGLGRHVYELGHALADQGIEIHLLTPQLRGGALYERAHSHLHIHRVPVEPPQHPTDLEAIHQANRGLSHAAQALFHTPPDLIHTHDWLTASAGIELKHAWVRPLLATVHATERGRGQGYLVGQQSTDINQIEWQLTYEAWRVIACSQFMAHQVHEYFQTPTDKITVVPNGVRFGVSPFANNEERLEFRRQFATDEQPLAFYVGRLVYEKGVQVLLDAWSHVKQALPHARLIVAGTGGYRAELEQRAAALGLGEAADFIGFISDANRDRLYHAADVAVFPSLYEPFGLVALEAMAADCPVIVSRTGGLSEVVQPHETGLIAEPGDAQSLAWNILQTLQNPERASDRARQARQVAAERYSWEHVANETIAVYLDIYQAWCVNEWRLSSQPALVLAS